MNRAWLFPLLLGGLLVSACTDNNAPGNDREAELAPPEPAAEVASAGEATAGVATDLLSPQILTDVDLRAIPGLTERCLFRFTRVGLPVLAYASDAVLKLNGKLVPLPATGPGRYAADGVEVSVRPLDEDAATTEPFAAELVLRFADAPHELGYHGFSDCGAAASPAASSPR